MDWREEEQLDALLIIKAAELDTSFAQQFPIAYQWATETVASYARWAAIEIEKQEAPRETKPPA